MKIIIAGAGKVGETLTAQLSEENYEITLIDTNADTLEACVSAYDVIAVHGNCATTASLTDAGVENADLLIAATGNDEVNLLCSVTAHALNEKLHTIARIRDPEYTDDAVRMRQSYGLSMVFNPEKQAAEEIARLIRYPGFLRRDTFAKGRTEIVELKLEGKHPLIGVSLSALPSLVKCKVLVCAVLRDGKPIIPSGTFVLAEGDRIFVTAPTKNLTLMLKNLKIVKHKAKNPIIIGGGRISYYLADLLEKSGISAKIIEKDRERCEALAAALARTEIVCGNVGHRTLLESEGLRTTNALVTLTDLDELNMLVSIYGTTWGVPQVITKLSHVEDSKILDTLPVGSVICPRKLCASSILRYVRAMDHQTGAAITVHSLAEGAVEASEFLVTTETLYRGKALRDIRMKKNVLVASITRAGETAIPDGSSEFEVGDFIVVVAPSSAEIYELNDIFA
ncbi:MAG: Trk system potassium transporter TrkA [Clostridia bacterium]|nr:Trk system potassium transporter TrkA [Clostridia bacterium]